MKLFNTFLFLLVFQNLLLSNCDCPNCPLVVPELSTVTSTINISGSTNSTLGVGGQSVCQVCVNFTSEAIPELDLILTSPSGNMVTLVANTGISFNDNLTYDICFNACSDPVTPDLGFLGVFDTNAFWITGSTYTGSYYPSTGCLEDFTGSVNGNWVLTATDFIFLMEHEILDWYVVFADQSGLNCTNAGTCSASTCDAFAGILTGSIGPYCEGDAFLDQEPPIDYTGGVAPPSPEYSYTYFIGEAISNNLLEVTTDVDLTAYGPGFYNICGLSYLTADAANIPLPNTATNTFSSVLTATQNGTLCGDVTSSCVQYQIVAEPDVDFDGPTTVCDGVEVCYDNVNYDPNLSYLYQIVSGSFQSFIPKAAGDGVSIVWNAGLVGEICLIEQNPACGNEQECITVNVVAGPTITISPLGSACQANQTSYTITPSPGPGESYSFAIIGGTEVSFDGTTLIVQWDAAGAGEICATISGGACGSTVCIPVNVAPDLTSPSFPINAQYCQNATISLIGGDDPGFTNYFWTSTNATVVSTALNTAIVLLDNLGSATICYQVDSNCGLLTEVCQTVNVISEPTPSIAPVLSFCELSFNLNFTPSNMSNTFSWFGVGPGTVIISDNTVQNPSVTVDAAGTYFFTASESNGVCTENVTVQVDVADGLAVSTPSLSCNILEEYQLSITILDGTAPYFVDGVPLTGSSFVSSFVPSGSIYDFIVTDAAGCSTQIAGNYDCPCTSFAGTMAANTLSLCEDDFATVVAPSDAIFGVNDIGQFYVHDNSGATLGNVFYSNTTGTINFINGMVYGQPYYISYVVGNQIPINQIDLNDPCLSVSLGQPFVFYQEPVLTYNTLDLICGLSGNLDLVALPSNTNILLTNQSGPGLLTIINPSSTTSGVVASQPGNYFINVELFNGSCTSLETIEVEFFGFVSTGQTIELCTQNNDSFVVTVNVLNGTPPYTATINGSFAGNVFTSDPIASGDPYSIIIQDANGCSSQTIAGAKLCNCDNTAGTMSNDLLSACAEDGSTLAASSNLDFFITAEDTFSYILHTGSGASLGDIKEINGDGQFMYDGATLVTDSVYYVSIVTADTLLDGSINLSDVCLDIAAGQPIIWYSTPEVIVEDLIEQCDELFTITNGSPGGSWELISSPNGSITDLQFVNLDTSLFKVDKEGRYELGYTLMNGQCIAMDTLILEKRSLPSIQSQELKCSDDLMSYDVNIILTDLTQDYTIDGQLIIDGNYSVAGIASTDSITVMIITEYGCVDSFIFGPVDCSCVNTAGSITDMDTIELCDTEQYMADFSLEDYALGVGDTTVYVLFDDLPLDQSGIVYIAESGEYSYDATLAYDRVYYMALMTGDVLAGSIDLADPCLAISEAKPILWRRSTDFNLSEDINICLGEMVSVLPSIFPYYPVELSFTSDGGIALDVTLENSMDRISIPSVDMNSVWELTGLSGRCISSFDGEISISVTQEEPVSFIPSPTLCNNVTFGSSLVLEDILLDNTIAGEWETGGVPVLNGVLDFNGFSPDVYIISYSTVGFIDPCVGQSFELSITVEECICPLPVFDDSIALCIDDNDPVDLVIQGVDNYALSWKVLALENQINVPDIVNDQLLIEGSDEGEYQLEFTLSGNLLDQCDSIYLIDLSLDRALSAGESLVIDPICPDIIEVDLDDYLQDQDQGGFWQIDGVEVDALRPIEEIDGATDIRYIVAAAGACPADTQSINVEISAFPVIEVEAINLSCYQSGDGMIIINNTSGEDFELFPIEVDNLEGLDVGEYATIYRNEDGCDTLIENIVIAEPAILEVTLGDDIVVEAGDSVLIEAITSILENRLEEINWNDINGSIDSEGLLLVQSFDQDNSIAIEIVDENGCVSQDQINISVESLFPDIYIPNAIGTNEGNYFGVFSKREVLVKKLEIYDRWGTQIMRKENILSNSTDARWDGTFKGEPLNPAVFIYVIELEHLGVNQLYSGDITLIR